MSQQAHPRDQSCAARRFWRLALHRNSADSLPVPLKSPSIPSVGKAYASYAKIYTNSAQWQPECLVTGLISRQAHAISKRYASATLRKCYAPFRQPLTPSDEAYMHICTVRRVEAPVRGPSTYRSRTVPDPGTGIVDFELKKINPQAPGVTAEWLSKLNIPLCNLQIGLRVR